MDKSIGKLPIDKETDQITAGTGIKIVSSLTQLSNNLEDFFTAEAIHFAYHDKSR